MTEGKFCILLIERDTIGNKKLEILLLLPFVNSASVVIKHFVLATEKILMKVSFFF